MDQTSISAIIIDDEPNAINLLEMYLRQFPCVGVVGTETRAKEGLDLVKEKLPELVFLDIDMPDMDGLIVAGKIQSDNPYSEIVFTTAHQHYAYEALRIEPLDFLTKPFCIADLQIMIQKYKAKKEKKRHEKKMEIFINSQGSSPIIKLPTIKGVLFINVKNVVLLKSKSHNCDVYLNDGTVETITRNLYKVVAFLNSSTLFQTNRSTYINVNYLQRVDRKRFKCILCCNQTTLEEPIARDRMIYFDKMVKFPFCQDL